MKYQQMTCKKGTTSYQVTQRGEMTAEFSYHIDENTDTMDGKFWLDGIRLSGAFSTYSCMFDILQFVVYKCRCAKKKAIYLKISGKNLFYMEQYKRFGFYVMDEIMYEIRDGVNTCEYVMKYLLPETKEQEYMHYIRGK